MAVERTGGKMSGGRILEPSREIPVVADYDVVVVGGGMAGDADGRHE